MYGMFASRSIAVPEVQCPITKSYVISIMLFLVCKYFSFLCVFVFSIMYGMYVLILSFILGCGQLLVLDESLSVLLAVS